MVIYHTKDSAAICFDDGPNPKVTPKIMEVLKQRNVKATFFLIGMRAEQYPDIAKQLVAEGHEIGNHSYTHKRLAQLFAEQGEAVAKEEIEKSHEAIIKNAGIESAQLRFFRPPYLDWDENVAKLAEPLYGNRIVLAHSKVGDYDWGGDHAWNEDDHRGIEIQALRIVTNWKENASAGSILGFHDSAEYGLPGNKSYPNWENRALPTLKALPEIIDDLQQKNLAIKTLSELEPVFEPLKPKS